MAQQAEEKGQFDQKIQQLETNMAEREEEHKQKLDEMLNIFLEIHAQDIS